MKIPESKLVARFGNIRGLLVLLFIWLAATALNLTKAFHIDDTSHLEIALAIQNEPLQVMTAQVNWRDTAEPIHTLNQPHLFFYLMAITKSVFGDSEIALHLLLSFFSLIAVVFCFLLAKTFCPQHPLYLTALLCLGPAFLPSQNVMVDIPLLACWLFFFWLLLAAGFKKNTMRYFTSALAASAACLIKYSSLLLPLFLGVVIALRKDWRRLWTLAIPAAALLAWSFFNLHDYGGIHLLSRDISSFGVGRGLIRTTAWVICLGAVSPFAILCIPYVIAEKRRRPILGISLAAALAILIGGFTKLHEPVSFSVLRALFLGNGLLLAILTVRILIDNLPRPFEEAGASKASSALLFIWFAGSAAFIILFAPAIAVRHLLIVLPVILFAIGKTVIRTASSLSRHLAIGCNFLLGALLGISDWSYADVYRDNAPKIVQKIDSHSTIWFTGHWGWKWYAAQTGMREYDYMRSSPQTGDFLVAPEFVDKQKVAGEHSARLSKVDEWIVDSTPATFFRVGPMGGFYASSIRRLPWIVSREPLEQFTIYRFD